MSILIRRNPIRDMAAMQSAMDRLFDDAWRGMADDNERVLAIDVHEADDAYTIMTNVPGVDSENIDITLHDGILTIAAELPKAQAEDGVRVHVAERVYGQFTRTISLPKAVDSERVEATFDNGVLTLFLPKTAEAQPRQIPIKAGNVLRTNN